MTQTPKFSYFESAADNLLKDLLAQQERTNKIIDDLIAAIDHRDRVIQKVIERSKLPPH